LGSIFSGVSDLQGVKISLFPLTLLVIVTTVLPLRTGGYNQTAYLILSNLTRAASTYVHARARALRERGISRIVYYFLLYAAIIHV